MSEWEIDARARIERLTSELAAEKERRETADRIRIREVRACGRAQSEAEDARAERDALRAELAAEKAAREWGETERGKLEKIVNTLRAELAASKAESDRLKWACKAKDDVADKARFQHETERDALRAELAAEQQRTKALEDERDEWEARALTLGWTGETYRHKKRGSTYTVLSHAVLQVTRHLRDNEPMVVYRGKEDRRLWVRSVDEFHDGRFEKIEGEIGK